MGCLRFPWAVLGNVGINGELAGTAVLFDSSSSGKFYTSIANQTAGYLNTATFFKSGSCTVKDISALAFTTEPGSGASSGNFVATAGSSISVAITLNNSLIRSTAEFLFDSGNQTITGLGTGACLAEAFAAGAIIAKFGILPKRPTLQGGSRRRRAAATDSFSPP
ncbi:MAG: hypothetical protein J0I10_02865 [Verrucomicrobia bacterium]|nr:hypothetical protein [Verrucomicrobiota bacterium]